MKTIRMLLILILTVMFCAFTPNLAVAAGGAGPEPGEGCPTEVRLGYVPPPFIGDIELYYDNNNINATGVLMQAGNPECTLAIMATPFITDVPSDGWQNLKPNDVRQRCVVNDYGPSPILQFEFDGCGPEYEGIQYVESVGVGNIRDTDEFHKIVRAVAMPLEE